MVGPGAGLDGPLARSESVEAEDHITQPGQSDAARLNVGVDPGPGPMAMDGNHGRMGPLDGIGSIEIGRDPDTRTTLEGQTLDRVAVATQDAEYLRIQRTRAKRHPTERSPQPFAHAGQHAVPAIEGRRSGFRSALAPRVAADERLIIGWGRSRVRCPHFHPRLGGWPAMSERRSAYSSHSRLARSQSRGDCHALRRCQQSQGNGAPYRFG